MAKYTLEIRCNNKDLNSNIMVYCTTPDHAILQDQKFLEIAWHSGHVASYQIGDRGGTLQAWQCDVYDISPQEGQGVTIIKNTTEGSLSLALDRDGIASNYQIPAGGTVKICGSRSSRGRDYLSRLFIGKRHP